MTFEESSSGFGMLKIDNEDDDENEEWAKRGSHSATPELLQLL
jgi:hypothetical protein